MKPQIRCNLTLSNYATANVYDDCFVIKVTRQISEDAVDSIKESIKEYPKIKYFPKYVLDLPPEVFLESGRWYLSVHKVYAWWQGVWPSTKCPQINDDCTKMHDYVMSTILDWQANQLKERLRRYTHED